jgi:hypothetical protein
MHEGGAFKLSLKKYNLHILFFYPNKRVIFKKIENMT